MQLIGLQYLRFFSAMLVVVMHATEAVALRMPNSGIKTWGTGSVGVDIFFVISGFVMALTTVRGDANSTSSWLAARKFMWRRLIRIAPMYWIYTLLKILLVIALPAFALRTTLTPDHVLASFFFWPATAPWGLTQPILPVGWSLNFEMLFYFIFALAIWMRARPEVFCLVAFLALFGAAEVFEGSVALAFFAKTIIFEFLYGVAIALIAKNSLVPSKNASLLILILGAVFIFIPPAGFENIDRAISWGIPAAMLVLGTVGAERWIPSAQLTWKRFAFWGDASYSIYLSHSFVVPGVVIVCSKLKLDTPTTVVLLVCMASIFVGGLSYKLIEKPITQKLKAIAG